MAFTPKSAKNATVRIGAAAGVNPLANIFVAKSWNVDFKTDKIDTSNFEGGGFGDAIGGLQEADISIDDADWDTASNGPYANPPNFVPTTIISCQLYLNNTGLAGVGPYWLFSNCLVVSASNACKVRDSIKIPSIKLYGKGSFSTPTGAA